MLRHPGARSAHAGSCGSDGSLRSPSEFQHRLREWLASEPAELSAVRGVRPFSIEDRATVLRQLHRALYASGWIRWGWPEHVGGNGGPALLRGILHDELCHAGYQLPDSMLLIEILGPMVISRAPAIAQEHFGALLAGEETWSQGFSETEAGSDLAGLRCRAEPDGKERYRINGHKVWSSFGHLAKRCLLLARTGSTDSRHRGLTMFLVDHDTPGLTVRPIPAANGRNEFAEIMFEDVVVLAQRIVGSVGDGWAAAMDLLQWERGMFAWQRQAGLHAELSGELRELGATASPMSAPAVGRAYRKVYALRLASRRTLRALSDGDNPGPVVSVDKILLADAEHALHAVSRELRHPEFELGVGEPAELRRAEFLYGRTASIYGGSAEMQRIILADQILGLPKEGRS